VKPGEFIGGRFAIDARIGAGGMADIVRARELDSGRMSATSRPVSVTCCGSRSSRIDRRQLAAADARGDHQAALDWAHQSVTFLDTHEAHDATGVTPLLATAWLGEASA